MPDGREHQAGGGAGGGEWRPDILTQVVEQLTSLRREVRAHAESDEDMWRKIDARLQSISDTLDEKYVSQSDFKPVRMIVYGMVRIALGMLFTGIVALVVIGRGHIGP